jgi:hypothetical protein
MMKSCMFGIIWKQHKVLNPIVSFYPIDMMDSFFRFKVSSNMFFHYKTMFKDISIERGMRMVKNICQNISIFSSESSTFPHIAFFFKCFSYSIFANFIFSLNRMLKTRVQGKSFHIKIFTFERTIYPSTLFYLIGFYKEYLFTYFTYSFFTCSKTYSHALRRTKFLIRILSIKFRITNFTNQSSRFSGHIHLIKKPLSAFLEKTVKFSRVLGAKLSQIKIPFSLSNLSITQTIGLSNAI